MTDAALYDGDPREAVSLVRAFLATDPTFTDWQDPDRDMQTIVMISLYTNNRQMLTDIIFVGCDVTVADANGLTAIHHSIITGNPEILAQLLLNGGETEMVVPSTGETPLIMAARLGVMNITRELLKNGANVDARNSEGHTALMQAVLSDEGEISRVLIESGCDPTIRDNAGKLPIHVAHSRKDPGVMQVFSGANECLSLPCNKNISGCVNFEAGFECQCKIGYFGPVSQNGESCTDVDECESGSPCHKDATCFNSPGSYSCNCDVGYTGDGVICIDVNECTEFPCSDEFGICKNTIGSFECPCKIGYNGDGTFENGCVDDDECASEGICDVNADCLNSQGSFYCECDTGFTGDGFICQDVDECSMQPCVDVIARCSNTFGSFYCSCAEGYKGSGIRTEYYETNLPHLLPDDYHVETLRELTRQELPTETDVDYWECVGNFTDWEQWSPLACPCDTATRNHTRTCVTDDNICDWDYCDWRIGDEECVAQEPCDVAPCPEPPVQRITQSMTFDVDDSLTREEYCQLLYTIRTKYGFSPKAQIKLDVGEFHASVCD